MLDDFINLHRAGRLDEAEAGYRQWLAERPDDAGAWHLLGILRGQRGDLAEGLRLVSRASELDPDDAPCQHTLGEMYLKEGRLAEAAGAFERARVLNPNLAAARVGLGHVALRRGDLDTAESQFRTALRAQENDAQALTGLGDVAQGRGDSARALQWFAQAAEHAPDDPQIQAGYARALLDQDMLDFAASAIDNALTVRPDFPQARALRAEVHVRKGEIAAAMPIFESMLARGENVALARAGLGDIAQAQGRHAQAIAQYDEALRLQPDFQDAAIRRAQSLLRSGKPNEAINDLRGFIAAHPDRVKVHIELARVLMRAGRIEEALATCVAAEARWPDSVDAKAQHAIVLDHAGHHEQAMAMADHAAASPRPAIAILRARGALLAGDPAAALQRLQRVDESLLAGRRAPMARQRHRLQGLAYDRLEQWPEAVAQFMRAQPPATSPLPELASLDDTTRAAITANAGGAPLADAGGAAPLFLCGLPGSRVEQVAERLALEQGVQVRRDRFASAPDFITAAGGASTSSELDPAGLAMLARRYRRGLRRGDFPAHDRVIDWIPALDAQRVPAIKRALPGARLLLVTRDPHDMLLDWLAFGWMPGFPVTDVLAAARWLRLAHAHLALAGSLLPTLAIHASALSAERGAPARDQIADFLGIPPLTDAGAPRRAGDGVERAPFRFAAGHARHYRECIPDALAALDGLSVA